MGDQCGAQGRQLLVSLEFAEALGGFVCGGDKTIHWNASVLLSVAE